MDFGPQNSLLQRITKEQLLAGKNKAILCVSRLDLRTFQDQLLRSSKILSNLYKVRDWVQLCGFSLHYLHATRCSKRCNFQLTSAAIWEVVTPTHLAVWTAGYPRSCKSLTLTTTAPARHHIPKLPKQRLPCITTYYNYNMFALHAVPWTKLTCENCSKHGKRSKTLRAATPACVWTGMCWVSTWLPGTTCPSQP